MVLIVFIFICSKILIYIYINFIIIKQNSKAFGNTLLMQDIGGTALSATIPTSGYHVDDFMPIALKIGTDRII